MLAEVWEGEQSLLWYLREGVVWNMDDPGCYVLGWVLRNTPC